jgi:hypothetical protein
MRLGKIARGIGNRLGEGADTGPGALHVARDHQQIGRAARQAVNRRGDDNTFSHSAALSWASWLVCWTSVETRS